MFEYRLTNHGYRDPGELLHQWYETIETARDAARRQHLIHYSIYLHKPDGAIVEMQHTCRV